MVARNVVVYRHAQSSHIDRSVPIPVRFRVPPKEIPQFEPEIWIDNFFVLFLFVRTCLLILGVVG